MKLVNKFFLVFIAFLLWAAPQYLHAQSVPRVLVFSKTAGYRHTSIEKGVATIHQLGKEHGFHVDHTEDAAWFTKERLAPYQAIIFMSTSGDVFDADQEEAFKAYMKAGGGFVGVHAASTTEYDWPWYGALVGAYFVDHPKIQPAVLHVCDTENPATSSLPNPWKHTDEWYNYRNLNKAVHVLLKVDESSYQGGKNGKDHPIAWCHEYEGGRAFYTGLGHTDAAYDEVLFQQHLLGGIAYAMGK